MIIIPDIHGRQFWKAAVEGHETEEIIFLGDYVDPYPRENIAPKNGAVALIEVLKFKAAHPDNVTLLLGNHDLSYITEHVYKCRHDYENHDIVNKVLTQYFHLFDIAHEKVINGRRFVFSHAGILPGWLKNNKQLFGEIEADKEVEVLNRLFHEGILFPALGDISVYRGGNDAVGSCVWADMDEYINWLYSRQDKEDVIPFQVFGHTQQCEEPYIEKDFACLDCRRGFILDNNGNFHVI